VLKKSTILKFVPRNGGFPEGEKFCIDLDERFIFAEYPSGRVKGLAELGWRDFAESLRFAINAVRDEGPSGWKLLDPEK
jgi:hypothetical protein